AGPRLIRGHDGAVVAPRRDAVREEFRDLDSVVPTVGERAAAIAPARTIAALDRGDRITVRDERAGSKRLPGVHGVISARYGLSRIRRARAAGTGSSSQANCSNRSAARPVSVSITAKAAR